MTRSARRSLWAVRPRAAAATLLASLLLLPGAPVAASGPVPGAAGTPEDEQEQSAVRDAEGTLRVVLDDLDPVVAHVGQPLTLRGRIVNDSTQQRRLTLVTVRSAWLPLAGRSDITAWLEGTDQRETGWVLGQDAVGPVVVPGASVPFRVEIPEWGLDAVPGEHAVLALEVEATGEAEPGTAALAPEPVVLRTVLPVTRAHTVDRPLQVSWVVPLTLPADPALTSRDDDLRQEAWLAATGPGSLARTWLEHLDVPEATWMVDPTLLVPVDPAEALAEDVLGEDDGDGTPQEEDGRSEEVMETSEEGTETSDAPAPEPADGAGATASPPSSDDATATTAAPGGTAPGAVTEDATAGPTGGTTGGTTGDTADGATGTAGPGDPPSPVPGDEEDPGEEPAGEDAGPATAEDVEAALVSLRGLLGRTPGEQLWWTPVADPDVAALLGQRRTATTVRTAMDLELPAAPAEVERLLRRGRSDIAWPALTSATPDQVAALDRFWSTRPATPEGAAGVVLPAESVGAGSGTPVGAAARRVQDNEAVTVLGADSTASALLAGAEADALQVGAAAVAQRLLADSLAAYQQDPTAARSILYAPPRGAQVPPGVVEAVSEGLQDAPWTRGVTAARLLAGAQELDPAPLSASAPDAGVLGRSLVDRLSPRPSPLGARNVGQLRRLHTTLEGLTEIIGDDSAAQSWEPALSHLWSTRWREDPEAWTGAWRATRRPVVRVQEAVHVNPSTVNFLSDQGIMQVTLVNDLPVPVEDISVELVPDRSLLRVVQQPEAISIGAGSRATVSFTAQAVTRGVTTVRARLTTPNGTVLGDDAEVSVRVQPTGVWIYWVLGSIAGLVLVVGLLRARRTAPRAAVVAAAVPDPETPDPAAPGPTAPDRPSTPEENR